jgi:hypothetical protein
MAKKAKKKTAKKKTASKSASDWRPTVLNRIRKLIKEAAPQAVEEAKWKKPSNSKGVPTWSQDGIICTGETYKDKVKLTFAKGASLKDPSHLFNASLDGGTRRAIDIRDGEKLDERAFKALIKEAVELNTSKPKKS